VHVSAPSRSSEPAQPSMRWRRVALVAALLEVAACSDCASCDGDDAASLLSHNMRVESRRVASVVHATPAPQDAKNASRRHQKGFVPRDAAEATGVEENNANDFEAFVAGLGTNSLMMCICMVVFMVLRVRYPPMFSYNVINGTAPETPPEGIFGWAQASWRLPVDRLEHYVGLDQAMLFEFTHLGMRLMLRIGAPLVCVVGPMNFAFGGMAAGKDQLSYLSIANVEQGHWLHWVYAFVVWYVVVVVQMTVYEAQAAFLPRRFKWLRTMPEPRSTTVLVENIPPEHRSDEELRKFFGELFSADKVKSAYVVKHTGRLQEALNRKTASEEALHTVKADWEKTGNDPAQRPRHLTITGQFMDSIEFYEQAIKTAETDAVAHRERINKASADVGGVNAAAGFVTFHDRSDAEVALSLSYTADMEEWIVSNPPDPQSIRWEDLKADPNATSAETTLGYALIVGLYVGYLPIIIGIGYYASQVNMGPLQLFWMSFAPSLGLLFMMNFLPTFLLIIFRKCFSLKCDAWSQQHLHTYYFWFNMVFVVLVTAVGQSFVGFAETLIAHPLSMFELFGSKMPTATHFYMNYLVLQWVSHSMNMMRYVNMFKYLAFRKLFDEETARSMSEPEDQDFYGTGSRSTRWTTNLVISIVFSSISPMISVLGFINFFICRAWYGYLIPFAETKKPDLGGEFWVQKLRHIFVGLLIYSIMMTGVLLGRASSPVPGFIAAGTLPYVAWSYHRFHTEFFWEKLPFSEFRKASGLPPPPKGALQYTQPELAES